MTHNLANGPLCVFQKIYLQDYMKQFLYAALIEVVFGVPRLIIIIFTGTRFRKNRFILEG